VRDENPSKPPAGYTLDLAAEEVRAEDGRGDLVSLAVSPRSPRSLSRYERRCATQRP
jgi:hypothetical protein